MGWNYGAPARAGCTPTTTHAGRPEALLLRLASGKTNWRGQRENTFRRTPKLAGPKDPRTGKPPGPPDLPSRYSGRTGEIKHAPGRYGLGRSHRPVSEPETRVSALR